MNNKKNKIMIDPKIQKEIKIFKGIIASLCVVILALLVYWFVATELNATNAFTQIWIGPICLFTTGIIALLLPRANKMSLRGDTKGDNLVVIAGGLLIALSIMTLIFAFMQ